MFKKTKWDKFKINITTLYVSSVPDDRNLTNVEITDYLVEIQEAVFGEIVSSVSRYKPILIYVNRKVKTLWRNGPEARASNTGWKSSLPWFLSGIIPSRQLSKFSRSCTGQSRSSRLRQWSQGPFFHDRNQFILRFPDMWKWAKIFHQPYSSYPAFQKTSSIFSLENQLDHEIKTGTTETFIFTS